jgi:hypothetical protein
LLVALSAYLPAPVLVAAVTGKNPAKPRAFRPYLDTLLPADGSPAASELGLDTMIIDGARVNPNLTRLIELGCAWLDQQASQRGVVDFSELDEAGRIAVVTAAEKSSPRSLPQTFFTATRDLAFREYYVQPAAWEALGYSGPPQPQGFPGHDQQPGDAT